MSNKFYTPDGFNDTLPSVCAFKKDAESKLRRLFSLHGYEEIETPGYEYCDIYTKPDFVKEEDLYKLTDSKGRLLCARYDGTIPAARYAATLAKDRLPLRLSYIENMYRFNQTGGGKQSEFTQAGAELMGITGSDSDAEIIAMAIRSALEVGVEDLQVSIGQVGLFEGAVKQMGLDEETALSVRNAIIAKDSVTIDRTAKEKGLSDSDRNILLMFAESSGDTNILASIKDSFTEKMALDAIKNLEEILEALEDYGYTKYVSVDLGLLGSEGYYTGVIFKGYTYEVGFPIIGGGRYDRTVGVFGRDMECVGFSLGLSLAITALMRQGLELENPAAEAIVGYEKGNKDARSSAISLADQMRLGSTSVILDTSGMSEEDLNAFADENDIQTVFWINGGKD
ncbi:ATP phosphoribosyltransferase regulatory subunit [Oscillospiraceae bacterium]|nr:ATP phosphoribosyltransferase regulatory subunit [Oscillospiraceae bacterium]